jgi:hypothetical protein
MSAFLFSSGVCNFALGGSIDSIFGDKDFLVSFRISILGYSNKVGLIISGLAFVGF